MKLIHLYLFIQGLIISEEAGTELSLSGSSTYLVLNQPFTLTCTVTVTSLLDDYINFYKKNFIRKNVKELAILEQIDSRSLCSVYLDVPFGSKYMVSCGTGTRDPLSRTKKYTLFIKKVEIGDATDWSCALENAKRNSNNLSLHFTIKGQWSAWFKQTDQCQSNCQRTFVLNRTCARDPVPLFHTVPVCNGKQREQTKKRFENCTGDLCIRVDGLWGPWTTEKHGRCISLCIRRVYFIRNCINPKPSGGGVGCVGNVTRVVTERCTGDDCIRIDGKWTSWERQTAGRCLPSCKREVTLVRSCTNPRPSGGGSECSGNTTNTINEQCAGESCNSSKGLWGSWLRQEMGPCLRTCFRTVVLSRQCRTDEKVKCVGSKTDVIFEKCSGDKCIDVDGKWTAWHRESVGICLPSCERKIVEARSCTNPRPAGRGDNCPGPNKMFVTEQCFVDKCVRMYVYWSEWYLRTIGPCLKSCKRVLVLKRNCTAPVSGHNCSGQHTRLVSDVCVGDLCEKTEDFWSAWKLKIRGSCSPDCEQNVVFTRMCLRPTKRPGAPSCHGNSTSVVKEQCLGGKCIMGEGPLREMCPGGNCDKIALSNPKIVTAISVPLLLFVVALTGCFIIYMRRSRQNMYENRVNEILQMRTTDKSCSPSRQNQEEHIKFISPRETHRPKNHYQSPKPRYEPQSMQFVSPNPGQRKRREIFPMPPEKRLKRYPVPIHVKTVNPYINHAFVMEESSTNVHTYPDF